MTSPSTLLITMLMAAIVALGMYLDRKEEAKAHAFMSRCITDHTYRECLILWGPDTDVFEGEPM